MRRWSRIAATLIGLAVGPVASQAPTPVTEIATRLRIESPDNASPTWREERLEWRYRSAPREVLIARAIRARRFGRADSAYLLAGSRPIDALTTGYAEWEGSENHSFLPRDGLYLRARRELGQGWGVIGGARHRRYNVANVNIASLAVDRYIGAYRAAFTMTSSHSDTAGNGGTRRAQLIYYYGRGSLIQGSLSGGTEVEKIPPNGPILTLPVATARLSGRHWLSPRWGIDYAAARARVGRVTRAVLSAGVRYRY